MFVVEWMEREDVKIEKNEPEPIQSSGASWAIYSARKILDSLELKREKREF